MNCRLFLVPVMFLVLIVSEARSEQQCEWTMSEFTDFVQGHFTDGGSNSYAAADGTIRLHGLWDLNNDGHFDLPVMCPQNHNEAVDLEIFHGTQKGYTPAPSKTLPGDGAVAGAAADLNGDGWVDLVIANYFDGEKTNLNSWIYWNSPQGFDADRKTELETKAASGVAVDDLNGDGKLDIVFANAGVDYHMVFDRFRTSYIYWGNEQGYGRDHRTELPTEYARDVKIIDLNGDGIKDLVFALEGNTEPTSGGVIFYGNADGDFLKQPAVHLAGIHSSAVAIDDLNSDGYLDIVLANKHRIYPKCVPPTGENIKTHRVNSYIYWGSANGYDTARRTELPTVGAACVATGDLNGDGKPEIVFGQGELYNQNSFSSPVAYIYWNRDGNFQANMRTQVKAWSANGCKIEDLDGDGHNDLVLADSIRNGSLDTNSFIYWSTANGVSLEYPTALPTHGAKDAVIADFNRDGIKDVVFVNKASGFREKNPNRYTKSYVYWGDAKGNFDVNRRLELPNQHADMHLTADFNIDGWEDLLIVNSHDPVIYFGGPDGLSPQRCLTVPIDGIMSMRTADFDRDGWLDLFCNNGTILFGGAGGFYPQNAYCFEEKMDMYPSIADLNGDGWIDIMFYSSEKDAVVIYWNSAKGFTRRRSQLSVDHHEITVIDTADLNRDGWLDLIFVARKNKNTRPGPGQYWLYHGNPNTDSLIFWGSEQGFSKDRQQGLPTVGPDDVAAADMNNDGWLDLIFPSYHAGTSRLHPGYIYWNSPDGFQSDRRSTFANHSGCGVLAVDTNHDGWRELIVANHVHNGKDHSTAFVWIYQNGPQGLSDKRRIELPATGPHYFTYSDVGNVVDRSYRFDYISPPHDTGKTVRWTQFSSRQQTPFQTQIVFQIRTADSQNDLLHSPWQGPDGTDSFYEKNSADLTSLTPGRWIQYKATLVSPNMTNTPTLKAVSIRYE